MAAIEGPLSKWTNVVKGWQYRWFVLDDNAGLLSYYTSKDKMKRGSRRGCVRLKGAIIGIDDEDDSTFTITVDHKTFHFQARDADERERWIETLENTIVRHSRAIAKYQQSASVATAAQFDHKLAETDAYLQLLINQVKTLEGRIESCEDVASREKYNVIKVTANAMIEAIKHSIVMLQISKETLKAPLLNGSMHEPVLTQAADFDHYAPGHTQSDTIQATGRESPEPVVPVLAINGVDPPTAEHLDLSTPETFGATAAEPVPDDDVSLSMPTTSYSSSDDEDFFDAEEDQRSPRNSPTKSPPEPIQRIDNGVAESVSSAKQVSSVESAINKDSDVSEQVPKSNSVDEVVEDYYDELYDEKDEEGLGSLEKHGSIITHLLSQVRIGMDLTKVVLPTFILERRSLLEMFADFFAHPDLFVKVPDIQNPRDRMVQVVRWYMSAFHAGRNSEVAKKPYNPILGETFACYWNVPGYPKSSEHAEAGPLPNVSTNNLTFIAEQVSHHPPISAYYAEHHNQRITLDGYVWTKSKFLGLSIGVHMIGQAVLSLLDWDEEYIMTFPNGYGRSILTVPWVEMGGKTSITCAKTGYSASIDFLTKPFYGGKKHRIAGGIYAPNEKKPFCTLDGEWNGVVWAKHDTGMNESFVDTHKLPITKKQVFPRDTQSEFESRRLWQNVTVHLKKGNVEKATEYKQGLEQRQRDAAKERKEKRLNVETNHFHEVGEHWVYDRPLGKRLSKSPSTPLRPL